jgi:hypothetical protein
VKNAPGTYNLSCVLLIADPPSGFDRAATARPAPARDRSGFRWTSRLTCAELSSRAAWAARLPRNTRVAAPSAAVASVRIGERAPWTDPAGL